MRKIIFIIIASCFLSNFLFSQEDSFIEKTEEYLKELAKDEHFGLSISISKDKKNLLEKAYGYANREHKVPNKINTKFNIASIGKLFTATSIMQLKEQGKIKLDKTIGNYLPEFPNQFIRDSVTIHQLLTHSSGLPLWFNQDFDQNPKFDFLELKDYLPLYETLKIDKTRIGNNHYSNVGYITLGFIIEEISKISYKEYLNQHIFNPLKMEATNIWMLTEVIPNVATGYIRPSGQDDWWKTNYHLNKSSSPAGGAYSSSNDLIKFYNGLLSNQLINEKTKQLMISPKIKTYYGDYGYGIGISKNNHQIIIGHLGGYYGIRGELMWYKDANYIVSILANSDQTDYIDVSHFIKTELTGTEADKKAFQNTSELIKSLDFSKLELAKAIKKSISKEDEFDEVLIQIKGYYYYNNKNYDKAKKLFYLNTLLFPDSKSAQNDLSMIKE